VFGQVERTGIAQSGLTGHMALGIEMAEWHVSGVPRNDVLTGQRDALAGQRRFDLGLVDRHLGAQHDVAINCHQSLRLRLREQADDIEHNAPCDDRRDVGGRKLLQAALVKKLVDVGAAAVSVVDADMAETVDLRPYTEGDQLPVVVAGHSTFADGLTGVVENSAIGNDEGLDGA